VIKSRSKPQDPAKRKENNANSGRMKKKGWKEKGAGEDKRKKKKGVLGLLCRRGGTHQ